jgi:hypothetical protein
MHQTTVRFSPDLWESLEREAAGLGVSVAQYVREAALTRLTYRAGQRGDAQFEAALVAAGVTPTPTATTGEADVRSIGETVYGNRLAAEAVANQSEQVRRRAREIRDESERVRRERKEVMWRRE